MDEQESFEIRDEEEFDFTMVHKLLDLERGNV